MKKDLTQSLEDYLEAIYFLEKKSRVARVKDIAARLSVQMPSVTGALRNLKERGLVDYEKNSFITLTPSGLKAARSVYNKHRIIYRFLGDLLKVDPEDAETIACKIEHDMPVNVAARLDALTEQILEKSQTDREMQNILDNLAD